MKGCLFYCQHFFFKLQEERVVKTESPVISTNGSNVMRFQQISHDINHWLI